MIYHPYEAAALLKLMWEKYGLKGNPSTTYAAAFWSWFGLSVLLWCAIRLLTFVQKF